MGLPDKLDALTHKAMKVLDAIMDEEFSDPEFVALMRVKTEAAKVAISTRTRADEATFRIRQGDQLAEILRAVLQRKAELREASTVDSIPPPSDES